MTLFGYRVPMMASLLVWCVIWEIVGRLELIFIVPPFSDVLVALVDLVQQQTWQDATITTLRAFAIGMVLSIAVGIPLGILMGRVKLADDLLGMWVNIFSSAPLSAIVPVLMILFGFGEKTIVAAVFLFAIWIIVLDTRAGVRHISPSLIEMARSYGALFETFSRNFRMSQFWALTIILFAFAIVVSVVIEWAEGKVEYYAGAR